MTQEKESTEGTTAPQEVMETGVTPDGFRPIRIMAVLICAALVIFTLVVIVSQFVYYTAQETRYTTSDEISYPDLELLESQAAEILDQYSLLDEEAGVYRIPINRAIELVAGEAAEDE